jgi:hypothetical protein
MRKASKTVLMVTAVEGAENLAAALSRQADVMVQVARNRRSAMAVLRREEFTILLVDSALAQADSDGVETLWQRASLAVPMEINIASVGPAQLIRLVRGVLIRREHESLLARRAAEVAIEDELRSHVTGLLLQSDLMLREKSVPPILLEKIKALRELADGLRVRLRSA